MEKVYFTINEVCEKLDIKPHTIRYWETEFPQLRLKTKRGKIKRYNAKEMELLSLIKTLIYEKKFTLEGAHAEVKKIQKEAVAQTKSDKIKNQDIDIIRIKNELLEIKRILLKRT